MWTQNEKVNYIIRAALAEETNDGWVWICGPSTDGLDSRTVLKMKRSGRCRSVYAELRTIDRNFLQQYNDSQRTIDIDCKQDTIVMAEWYRRALAISSTTDKDNSTGRVPLIVSEARVWGWRSLRAACHHPDPVARLGSRLGLLGAWLGVLGVWLGFLGVCAVPPIVILFGFVLLGLLGVLGMWAGWGPPRPRLR
jgi:hypothetical protein